MKTLASIFSPLLLLPVLALCQEEHPKPTVPKGYHQHDGFYLSMNIGPALGGTILKASGSDAPAEEVIYRGPGALIDFRIGGAVRENLILSFDIVSRTIVGPEIEVDGTTLGTASDDISANDNIYGVGLTYYWMPSNLFLSGTLGTGQMVIRDEEDDTEGKSRWGFAMRVKAGKEWWVGKNWGLGVSGGYGIVIAKDEKPPVGIDYDGTLTSHQFYVLFNTTFN